MVNLTELEAALAEKGIKIHLLETEQSNRIDAIYSDINDTKEAIDQVIIDIYSTASVRSRVDDGTYRAKISLTLE